VSRLVITLETTNAQPSTARHAFTQRLDVIRRALMDGITMGVLDYSADSRVGGAWMLTLGDLEPGDSDD
jgi:hypothetical protein